MSALDIRLINSVDRTPATADAESGRRSTRRGIPFARLFHVELRKQVDTRASLALLIVIVVGMLGITAIEVFGGTGMPKSFSSFQMLALMPLLMLLPVIGILAVTSEWSQRTALVTFVWEPRRGRVILAKFLSTLLLAVLGAMLALAIAGLGTWVAGLTGAQVNWNVSSGEVTGLLVTLVLLVAQGMAFGLLIQNTPGAIVAYFVVPVIMTTLSMLVSWIGKYAEWIDFTVATQGVTAGEFTANSLSKAGVAVAIWVVVPGVLGLLRMWRREIK